MSMVHKIELNDREFAVTRTALRELATRWIDPIDTDINDLLDNQFSNVISASHVIIQKDT